jgi:hypothetical protein
MASACHERMTIRGNCRTTGTEPEVRRGVLRPGPSALYVDVLECGIGYVALVSGPCDVVAAGRPGAVVRLHGRRGGWPTKVQVSTGGRFHTVSRARCVDDACHGARVYPTYVSLDGRHTSVIGQQDPRGSTWQFVYLRADS